MFRYIYSCLIFVVFSVISCKDDRKESHIELSKTRVDARFVSDTLAISVKSIHPWRAVADAAWVQVLPSKDGSMLEFLLEDNFQKESRQSYIYISVQGETVSLLVSQSGIGARHEGRVRDSMALIAMYEQCGGKQWEFRVEYESVDGWNLSAPFYTWRGVVTSNIGGVVRVTSLNLSGVGLTGVLPANLSWLDQLQGLVLSGNQIVESPFEILARLPKLTIVNLSYNPFRFTLPQELGSLANLSYLYLNGVDCSEVYGDRFSRLVELRELAMAGSNISGSLPQYLRSFVNLEYLNMSSNQLTGSLPEWLFSLSKLRFLDLSLGQMSGEISDQISLLTNLEELKLAVNNFSGEIPSSIGFMTNLKGLNLSQCQFSSMPLSIALCSELEYIDLSFNNIEGLLFFDEFLKLERLEVFSLWGNRLTGTISQQVRQSPKWKLWYAGSLICPQQLGYGFENCK